jgi:hopanoid biosynthesis associated protein HpnK
MPDARRLIVNADDFALHPSVNRAIILAHREGIVTSTTILAGGMAFLDAIEDLKSCPELGVGVHLCLVDQRPVLKPEEVSSLVNGEGRFCASYAAFLKRYLLGQIHHQQMQRELEAQVGRIRDLGLKITHLDSHQHLHLLPGIAAMAAEIARKFAIHCIRIPAERPEASYGTGSWMRRWQGRLVYRMAMTSRRRFARLGFRSPDHFFGFNRGGRLLLEDWLKLVPQLPPGVSEVMVHPGANTEELRAAFGWGYHWGEEFQALTHPQLRLLIMQNQVELVNYGDII